MLVLSRKSGESIRLGNDIVLTVKRTRGNRVQLAIEAPREVPLRRAELGSKPQTDSPRENRSGNRLQDYLRRSA
ncbi:Carbon storage regulator [Rhodopirellula maiorica SM1]|uniref:Translational regulator CsrA n=1 Tax=Rhodopirellula maiorica SM1 TaxID=1265738 RepID=M5RJI2_9BACT|nr:carbon storage regulator [Rhodopirellula maiorica]EMI19336.1 Carbon storage regulator [Rhodopirellula maiorica SM1]